MTAEKFITGSISRVATLPFPGIDGAYICLSGRQREKTRRVGDRWYRKGQEHDEQIEKYGDDGLKTEPVISFIYDAGNCCAEWDGSYGPIQLWWKTPEGWKPGDADSFSKAEKHWFYPFAFGIGHWSQMAVDSERLPEKFNEGDYRGIFRALKSWAESHNADYAEELPA